MTSNPDTRAAKQTLRRQCRQRTDALAPRIAALSSGVCAQLNGSDLYRSARTIMAFLPIPGSGEVDLSSLLSAALDSGKRICLPRVDWTSGSMTPAAILALSGLIQTRHGLREPPTDAPTVPRHEVDLFLIPGLAFDLSGNRLGRGAGYYDRFLASGTSGITCGICFEEQLVDKIPTDPWDVPVNVLATERRLITLRG